MQLRGSKDATGRFQIGGQVGKRFDPCKAEGRLEREEGREKKASKEQSITLEKQEHQYEVEETWREGVGKVRPRSEKGEEVKQQHEEKERVEGRNGSFLKRNTRGSSR